MSKREAKRLVCGVVAATIENDLAHAGYIFEEAATDTDAARIKAALVELADEMRRRSLPRVGSS